MRCKFCGSTSLHPDKQHKSFSAGKAVAGAVVFGPVGTAAGLIGKDQDGYRCGACGAFMDAPLDIFTAGQIDSAISDAQSGRSRSLYDYYKRQYANIETVAAPAAPPAQEALRAAQAPLELPPSPLGVQSDVKHSYRYGLWQPDCPVWIEDVIIHSVNEQDKLSLVAWDQSGKGLRSVFFRFRVLDDTGDEIVTLRYAYQNLSIPAETRDAEEHRLPMEKQFPLNTDMAARVEIFCEKAAFADGSVWRSGEAPETVVLPEQVRLTEDNFPRLRYADTAYLRRARRAGREVPVYLPIEGEGFWLCACGHPARAGQDCPFCGESFEMVQSELSQKVLEAAQQRAVKARAAQRAAALGKRRDALVAAREQAEIRRKDGLYDQAMTEIQRDTIESLTGAIGSFRSIPGWKDADEQLARCQARIDELKAKAEEERQEAERKAAEKKAAEEAQAKKNRKLTIVIAAAVAACIALALLISNFVVKPVKYNKAAGMLEEGRYAEAVAAFDAMGTYRDARARCAEAMNGLRRQYRQQGDQYLAQGDEVQAAICYLRAGERLLSRRAYDFESKLAVTHGTSAAVSRDGMFYYASNYKSRDRSAVAGIASISVLDMRYGIAGIGEDGKILIEDPFGLLGMGTGNEKLQRALDWSKVRQMTCRYGELVALSEDGTLRGIFSDDAEALIQPPTNVSWLIGSRHDAVWTLDSSDDLCWTAYVKGTRCNFDLSSFTSLKRFEFLSSGIVGITSDGQLVHSVDSTKRASFRWPFSDDEKAVDLAVSGSWVFVLREDGTVTPGYCGKIAAEDASKFAGWTKPIETQTSSWRKILYVRQVYGGVIGVDIDGVVHFVSTENTRAPDGVLTQHIEPGVSALMGQSTGIVYSAGYLYTYDHREALNVIVLCEDGTLRSLGTGKYITLEGKYPNYTPKIHLDGNYDNVSNWKLW